MRIIVCNDYQQMSLKAAEMITSQVTLKPNSNLGLATGATPIGMYENLKKAFQEDRINFEQVTTFNLDEYYPIDPENNQSYHYFMNEKLFSEINIKKERIHILNGQASDPEKECDQYEQLIEDAGGIDLQVLGIGENGHIGFNEPDSNLCSTTHLTELTDSTIKANSRFFDSMEQVPKQALTMGISTIMSAKKIILLASGANKSSVVSCLLNDDINTSVPATLLKVHPDVTLICDRAALGNANL